MEQCAYELRCQGRAYPRTCAECGLGPCKYQNKPPIPETAPTDAERKLALAVKALRHARDQIRHPDQLIDDALAAIANPEPQS